MVKALFKKTMLGSLILVVLLMFSVALVAMLGEDVGRLGSVHQSAFADKSIVWLCLRALVMASMIHLVLPGKIKKTVGEEGEKVKITVAVEKAQNMAWILYLTIEIGLIQKGLLWLIGLVMG